jgi:hypothetical protein
LWLVTALSCVVDAHIDDLARMSVRQLRARRRALAGSLAEQPRRCGRAGCRCADGEPHGPYAYFTPRPHGRGRVRYVPAPLAQVVRRYLQRGAEVEAVLAEISAVNAELLARRELE